MLGESLAFEAGINFNPTWDEWIPWGELVEWGAFFAQIELVNLIGGALLTGGQLVLGMWGLDAQTLCGCL